VKFSTISFVFINVLMWW